MAQQAAPMALGAIDGFVRAFEAAQGREPPPRLEEFLPAPDHPLYAGAVRELARVELEFAWERGDPRPVADYRRRFPDIFGDPDALAEIAFEEYRQRRERGERPAPAEYARRYGIDVAGWPGADVPWPPPTEVIDPDGAAPEPLPGVGDPDAARRLALAAAHLPEAGGEFLGFRLLEELGRGAFGRVFLARQGDLADRLVVLKISADLHGESQTLAQLQHTNIVPVYSVHRAGPFQAVCMPYFGATTLTDVLERLHDGPSLPDSGKHFVSTLAHRKSSTYPTPSSRPSDGPATPPAEAPPAADTPRLAGAPRPLLDKLEHSSYVDSVLWLLARLADGLAHAHERGVVHRDLKPANVLLTDDGQPMLLDFNLSEDSRQAAARVGGTLPYMAPEQLEAFQTGRRAVDGRSDLYALGLIGFELLTGRYPFPSHPGPAHAVHARLLEDRRRPPPRLRPFNKAVSPAAEAVVRRCLEPDPGRRYPTARALQEDLERQLAHLPLRHTREPSWRERGAKWARRHPRLTSSSAVGLFAAAVLLLLSGGAAAYWQHGQAEQRRHAARSQYDRLEEARQVQQALLNAGNPLRGDLLRGLDVSRRALAEYGVVENAEWQDQPVVLALEPSERDRLRQHVGEMLLTWSEALGLQGEHYSTPEERPARLALAWQLNQRAEACLAGGPPSRFLWQQRARLARLLDRPADAERYQQQAERTPAATARDFYLLAVREVQQREFAKAAALLREAVRLDARDFWAWNVLGNCYQELHQTDESLACYNACLASDPDPAVRYFPYFHRALLYLAQRKDREAEVDLDAAIAALPSLPEDLLAVERSKPYVRRALVKERRRDDAGADADLTRALEFEPHATALRLQRARVRERRNDPDGARQDREEALWSEPIDEDGWNARGLARLDRDAPGALADFEQALRLNPRFFPALQNQAHVLAERLGRPQEAVAALDRALALCPGFVPARAGHGVLLARMGRRAEAHRDAREALARDRSAPTLYQVANIYALTSRQEPKDRRRVLPLLAGALWHGYGLDIFDQDGDMAPVRDQPDVRQLLETVRELDAEQRR
jgi:eukaryotic-like serine/threonine-protein kinase